MEQPGILTKISFPELTPRVEYSLTPLGEELEKDLWKLNDLAKLLIENNDHF